MKCLLVMRGGAWGCATSLEAGVGPRGGLFCDDVALRQRWKRLVAESPVPDRCHVNRAIKKIRVRRARTSNGGKLLADANGSLQRVASA